MQFIKFEFRDCVITMTPKRCCSKEVLTTVVELLVYNGRHACFVRKNSNLRYNNASVRGTLIVYGTDFLYQL